MNYRSTRQLYYFCILLLIAHLGYEIIETENTKRQYDELYLLTYKTQLKTEQSAKVYYSIGYLFLFMDRGCEESDSIDRLREKIDDYSLWVKAGEWKKKMCKEAE